MKVIDIITEARVPSVRDQIIADVRKHGGGVDDYFVRFTSIDKLGFSGGQAHGHYPDVDNPQFDVDLVTTAPVGRRVLWFYPLKYYLSLRDIYATDSPYAWLVKLKPTAWLQTVKRGDNKVEPAPRGKERVGMLRMSDPPAAIFFKPAFDLIGRYYDYAGQHKRHGDVKGPPEPSFFDRVRGQV